MNDVILEFLELLFSEIGIEKVLKNILTNVKTIFKADRVTLFLYNQEEDVLESIIVSVDELVKIKIPVNKTSIAGYTFITKKLVNIQDVYNEKELKKIDPYLSHDKTWDKKYKYKTKSILAVPILKGEKALGVLEVINKEPYFTQKDEELIKLIIKFIALSVDNSLNIYKLYQKTEEEKIIIENISESVAITDQNFKIVDVNTSFLEMLGYRYDYEDIKGMMIEDILGEIGSIIKENSDKIKNGYLPVDLNFEFIKIKIIPIFLEQFGEEKLNKIIFIFKYPKG